MAQDAGKVDLNIIPGATPQAGQRPFPYIEGDVIVLGPGVFIDRAKQEVISYAGRNFYPRQSPKPEHMLIATVVIFLAIIGALCFLIASVTS